MRFCPACGNKLLQASIVKFCSNCGQNLTGLRTTEQASGHRDIGQEKPVFPQVMPIMDTTIVKPQERFLLHDQGTEACFSIVLKACGNRERLVSRLSTVLCRSINAMRLAVDLVPCVILYKSSANTRQAVIAILEEEQLPYGVIRGDFSLNSGPGFLGETAGFSDELKELLAKTPANLWLGDQFQFVVSEVEWEGGFGAMVVTDQGLYLADQSSSAPAAVWSIIPFYPLADVVRSRLDSSEIELVYRQAGREAWLKIEDSEQLAKVYTYLQRVLS